MRPSPARVAAPEPEVWLPITDLGAVLELEVELWASELDERGTEPSAGATASPSGNVTLVAAPEEQPSEALTAPAAPAPARPPARVLPGPSVTPEAEPEPFGVERGVELAPVTLPTRAPAPRRVSRPGTRPASRPSAPARPTVAQALVLTATAAAVAVGALVLLGPKQHEVTVQLDGRTATRSSDASTVGDLLHEQGIVLGPYETVVPGVSTSLRDGLVVRIRTEPPAPPAVAHAAARPAGSFGDSVPLRAAPPVRPAPPRPPAPTTPSKAATTTGGARSAWRPAKHDTPQVPSSSGSGGHWASGGASWYASPWGSDSCASRTLAFGTVVTIVNRATGATATCRVADRGPVARSRVLDLDDNVFRRLSPLGLGVISVRISW